MWVTVASLSVKFSTAIPGTSRHLSSMPMIPIELQGMTSYVVFYDDLRSSWNHCRVPKNKHEREERRGVSAQLLTLCVAVTRSSAIAEGPRDASCQLKSCQLPRNSTETTCTTSPEPSISCR